MNIIDQPENKLERLLRQAANEPAHRPEFYRVLLDSMVCVLGFEGEDDDEDDGLLSIQNWEREDGINVIPFFTSLNALEEVIEGEQSYLEMPVKTLFEITLGATLVLNPSSEYSKDFMPEEVNSLLESGAGQTTEQRIIEHNTDVMIGEVENYPAELIASLTTLFSKHDNLKAAYLAEIEDPDTKSSNLIIGVQGEGDLENVISEAGAVAWDTLINNEVLDFIVIDDEPDGICEYMLNETKPFYERIWGAKMQTSPDSSGQA